MLKRTAAIALAITFLSLAIAPETLAHQRNRRAGYYRPTTTYYSPSAYRGVAGTRYNSQPYYDSAVGTRYSGQQYDNRDYGQRYYRGRRNSTRNLLLTVGGPAALGAGIGAIAGGGKGAGIGALVGGGGGALFYLLKNRGRRR